MESETQRFRDYFLGYLGEAEIGDLEVQIISSPEIFEGLVSAENELIEDYLDDALNDEQARRFREVYLTTAARSENVEFVRALRQYASVQNLKNGERKFLPRGFQIKSLLWSHPKVAFGSLLIFGVCSLVLVGLYIRDRIESFSLQKEYAELNKQDLGNLGRVGDTPIIAIFPGSVRSSSPSGSLVALSQNPNVLFRLVLPSATRDMSSYDVILKKDGREKFGLTSIQPYTADGGREIRILVPRDMLKKGNSEIIVTATNDPSFTENYFLSVE